MIVGPIDGVVGVTLGSSVNVGVRVPVSPPVVVGVGVSVPPTGVPADSVGVWVGSSVSVGLGVGVSVGKGVFVGTAVRVGVSVSPGVTVTQGQRQDSTPPQSLRTESAGHGVGSKHAPQAEAKQEARIVGQGTH